MRRLSRSFAFVLVAAIASVLTVLVMRGRENDPAPIKAPSSAEGAMDRSVDDLRLEHLTFDQAIAELSKRWGVAIDCDRTALAAIDSSGSDDHTQIDLRATRITLADALTEVLDQAFHSAKGDPPEFFPLRDRIVITRRDAPSNRLLLNFYDIRDLMASPSQVWGKPLVYDSDLAGPQTELVGVLCRLIAPGHWDDPWGFTGGSPRALIEQANGRLIVRQTWFVQHQIRNVLARLRSGPGENWRPPPPPLVRGLMLWDQRAGRFVVVNPELAELAMQRPLEVNLDAVPLLAALQQLGAQAQVHTVIDQSAMVQAGYDLKQPVTLHAKPISLADAVGEVLKEPHSAEGAVGMLPSGWTLYVVDSKLCNCTRVYDVGEHLQHHDGPEAREEINLLVKAITEHVAPDSWRDNGGSIGSIGEWDERLIVDQTYGNQKQIASLLADLFNHPSSQPSVGD